MNTTQSQCGRTRSRIGKWLINRKLRKLQLDAAQEQQLETVFALNEIVQRAITKES